MAEIILDGLGVALVTPFHKDLSVDYESLEKILEYVINGGCDYIVAFGTTAETPTLEREEKRIINRFIKEKVNGRVPLVIGIGGNSTNAVVKDILGSNLEGYSAILSVTPYYNKPTQEGLFQHFKAISEASPLPLILYNVPGRTGANLSAKTTIRLAALSPKFYGIKEASGNNMQCDEIIGCSPAGFKVISGDDASVCPLMQRGASGVISVLANAYPRVMKRLVTLCRNGEYEKADQLQKSLLPLITLLFEDGNPAGVKALLHKMGLCENVLRLPLVAVRESLERKLHDEVDKLSLND